MTHRKLLNENFLLTCTLIVYKSDKYFGHIYSICHLEDSEQHCEQYYTVNT